jgi:hypothetical protein
MKIDLPGNDATHLPAKPVDRQVRRPAGCIARCAHKNRETETETEKTNASK